MPKKYDPLPNIEAISALDKKRLMQSYHYLDILAQEHAVAFTVSKMMNQDLLAETHQAILDSMKNSTDFNDFQKRLKPYLMSKGWWGEQVMTDPKDGKAKKVQLGSTRRLRTIYHTNKHTAYSAGQWKRIQATKKTFPYLKYTGSVSANPRLKHKRYYNLVLPVDHPIWLSIMPPNGWGCLCGVQQLTQAQAEAIGITKDFEIEMEEVENPRTGEKVLVPKNIDISFTHNHVSRLPHLIELATEKHGEKFAKTLEVGAAEIMLSERYTLPPASEWETVAQMGEAICNKHDDLFDVDLDQPHAFADAVAKMLEREAVETGAKVKAKGDKLATFKKIIERYPATWVEKSNELGDVYVRNLKNRGFHAVIETDRQAERLKAVVHQSKDFKMFERFKSDFKKGDSMLYLNNLHLVNDKAYDISIHEFGHRLQYAMPALDEYFQQLYLDRTKGERIRPLAMIQKERGERPFYKLREVGRKDSFANPYIGRDYGNDDTPKAKEILTMTMQTILGSGQANTLSIKKFLQDDPEMIYLAIALLARFRP